MTNKIITIEERVNRLLQDSLDELYIFRREETENLGLLRERSLALTQELRDLAARIDRALKNYERFRGELLESAKLGETVEEKALYDQASEAMVTLNSLEERHRLLSAQKLDLMNEERRLERSVARSDSMGNRLRMALNLMTIPEDVLETDVASRSAETLSAALQMVEREAAAFTRELHDGPTQTFSAVGLVLDVARVFLEKEDYESAKEEIDHALEQNRNGLNELRALLFSLSPTGIQEGFEAPLRRLTSQLRQMRGCKLSYVLKGDFADIPVNTKIGAFKTLHQAVLNAVLHGASEVKVSVRYTKNAKKILEARVTDNGEGFDVEREREAVKDRGSYGLHNMEERVKMLGGKLSISSVLKKGSSVSFSIPIPEP
ncbi:MAG: histidine kinase [Synergistaceae bacterium]|jgi:two-component system sensor histidine kinase DegS|nr:histidine kinase [Synergistaceae bacterium]